MVEVISNSLSILIITIRTKMKSNIIYIALFLSILISQNLYAQTPESVGYVNIRMGTDSKLSLSKGNTYSGIAMLWGHEFLGAANRRNGQWVGYAYDATHIQGSTNPSTQFVDQRFRPVLDISDDRESQNYGEIASKLVFT